MIPLFSLKMACTCVPKSIVAAHDFTCDDLNCCEGNIDKCGFRFGYDYHGDIAIRISYRLIVINRISFVCTLLPPTIGPDRRSRHAYTEINCCGVHVITDILYLISASRVLPSSKMYIQSDLYAIEMTALEPFFYLRSQDVSTATLRRWITHAMKTSAIGAAHKFVRIICIPKF